MEKKNSVLIVDDDSSNLMELFHILRSEYSILTAMDGVAALEKANEFSPDLILLDIIMPNMTGFEVLAELKKSEKTKSIPVVFITGLSDEGDESEGLAAGAVDYIRKPFNATVVKLRASQQIQLINLRRELENAVSVAEAASKSKSAFLANMSHEIRTPMNAIMGITDILMQNETLPDEIEDGLDKIYASSEMLLGIINDILDFSKIEAGRLDIIPAQYNIASMINDSVHLNVMRIGNRPIQFELQIEETIPAELIGDELRIKQILNNLLSNAFKYTDAGTVTMSVGFEPLLPPSPADGPICCVVLCIRDTGHGMTKEQLSRLFEEYSRFNENANRNIEGTGLGLSIMQRLVDLMSGEIHVESEPGKGTAVTIRLPQGIAGPGTLGKEVAENLQSFRRNDMLYRKRSRIKRDPMPYGSVLIVDDIETNLFVAVRLMNPYKLHIETAINGRDAIDKIIDGNVYDIIFMDHMMPEMDGMEATRLLREHGYTSPIVALTANAVAGQADVFLENGFDAFISKPIDIQQLDSILNQFVRDKQPPDVIEAARLLAGSTGQGNTGDAQPQVESILLESFIRDAQKAVSMLEEFRLKEQYGDEEDLRKFTITVHGMKSSLWNVDEKKLSELAGQLEEAGRDGNTDIIKSSVPELLAGLRVLLEKYEPEQDTNEETQDEDVEGLRNELLAIQKMCADYNRKGALDKIAGMKNGSLRTRTVLNDIKEYVLHSEFEDAESAASAYAKELSS